MSSINGYVTALEAAQIVRIDRSQICRYCQSGELPAIKIGNQWLIKEKDARNFKPNPRGNPNFVRTA